MRKPKGWNTIITGLVLILVGTVLFICAFPIFSHNRQIAELIPRSEIILNETFIVHQLEDKIVSFQLSIGQSIIILATSNRNMSGSIVNFTRSGVIQPDKPDVIYFFQNDTTTINESWSPPTRLPEPGNYYVVFLARDALPNSPVQVYANVTKTWSDIQIKEIMAEDRIRLLDERFAFAGSILTVAGTVLFSATLFRSNRIRHK